MIRIKVMIFALLFAILGQPIAAVASDVTNALYSGTIVISNNSTANTNVATTANISTDNLITGQYLNATANNTVVRNSSGADVPFQPGYTDANSWSFWVSSIGTDSYLTYILYTANSTGGEIRYFPGPPGMTTLDSAGLELLGGTTNFSIAQSGLFDTSYSANKTAIYKDGAFQTYISATDNITSAIFQWDSPTSTTDGTAEYTDDAYIYDDDTTTKATSSIALTSWNEFIQITLATTTTDRIRYWVGQSNPPDINLIDIDAYYDGSWHGVYQGVPTEGAWATVTLDTYHAVTDIQIRFYNSAGVARTAYIYEIDYGDWDTSVTATGLSSGEYTVTTALEPEPAMALWATDVNVGVNMGQGILPVKLIEEQTLTAPAASVTFSNIDTKVALWDSLSGETSRHPVVMVNAKSPDAAAKRAVEIQFNADVGANYNHQTLTGENAVADADARTGLNHMFEYPGGTDYPFAIPGTTYANAFGGGTILIPHAFNTTNHKSVIAQGGASEDYVSIVAGRWASVNAIASMVLTLDTGNFDTGSTFTLGVIDERYLVEEQLLAADGLPDFNGIPQDGHDLVVIGYPRSDVAAVEDEIIHEINGDAHAAAYPTQELTGRAAVVAAAQPNNEIGMASGDNAGANEFGALLATYSQYAEATNDPHYTSLSGYHESTGPTSEVRAMSGRWPNVAAIIQLEYYPNAGANFKAGSLFSLYRVPRYVISRQELTVATPTITFDDIPQNYQALQLLIYARSSDAIPISDEVAITLNTDAGPATFDWQYLEGTGAGPPTALRSAASNVLMVIPAAGEGANEFGGGTVTFPRYERTDGHKHFITLSGTNENQVILRSSRWESTAAITRIDLDPVNGVNFEIGSVFELVGLMPAKVIDIDIDGDIKGLADGNFAIPDTADDWNFVEAAAMPYMEYQEITINGTLQQDIVWEYDSTFHDRSYYGVELDGVNQYIPVGNDASLEITNTLTIEAWVKRGAIGGGAYGIVSKDNGIWTDTAYEFAIVADFVELRTTKAGGFTGVAQNVTTTVGTYTSTTEWYHVVGTYEFITDGTSQGRMYVDGVADGTRDTLEGPIHTSNHNAEIARYGNGQYWNGDVDEVRIYNRVLALPEIQANYNSGVGTYTPYDTTGLVGWWHMEEGTGLTTSDSSGNGNTGTLTNGPRWANGKVPLPFGTSGTNDATPSFRTASSDPNVTANMTSFLPISQAKAPAYALGAVNPFISGTGNVTGNFTIVPPVGTFPLAGVIAAVANATATPPQLPLLIIAAFVILAASLTTTYLLRKYGSGSLLVKAFVIIGFMGIFIALGDFGIDFWMLVVFGILATALAMMSRQQGWQ